MEFNIRKATKQDMPRVLELIKELAFFEKEPHAVILTENQLVNDGFVGHPDFICLVAQINNSIEGIALFYQRYSSWKGKVIHLEDLIVSKKFRGFGIGSALFDTIIKIASKKGVKRVSWEVLDWNDRAIQFYIKRGAKIMNEWRLVQLDEKAIENIVHNLKKDERI